MLYNCRAFPTDEKILDWIIDDLGNYTGDEQSAMQG
jgi:hypothetical protein